MRSNSGSKKADYERYLESRLLISSSSVNPLSKHISSKLDLIKQELSKEFHEKFPMQRKRTGSVKKNKSSSKLKKESESIRLYTANPSKKLFAEFSQSPQESNKQTGMDGFRDKYYELQDKLMLEREKSITQFEQLSSIRQEFMEFLEEPSPKTVEPLKKHFPSQRNSLVMEKIISLAEDVQFAETTLNEMMLIMEVEDIEALLNELKERQSKCRNLNECTFKIIELETAYNQLEKEWTHKFENLIQEQAQKEQKHVQECQDKVSEAEARLQECIKRLEEEHKAQVFICFTRLIQAKSKMFEEDSQEISQYDNDLLQTFDCNKLFLGGGQGLKTVKQEAGVGQLLTQIEAVFKSMMEKMEQIGREAEENMEYFLGSKHDMARLEKLIETVTGEMQDQKAKLIRDYNELILEKEEALFQIKKEVDRLEEDLEGMKVSHGKELERAEEERQGLVKKLEQKAAQVENEGDKVTLRDAKILELVRALRDNLDPPDKSQFQEILQSAREKEEVHEQLFREEFLRNKLVSRVRHEVNKNMGELKAKVQEGEMLSMWHEKELKVKENLLKEFDYNLKRLMEEVEVGTEKEKKLIFERDEYKYLLNNSRESILELKKEHTEGLEHTIKEKDTELLMSNRDILERNQVLEQELLSLKTRLAQIDSQLKTETASQTFFKRKAEHCEAGMLDLRKKVARSDSEIAKYKKLLIQIESSFKELEKMSEANTDKMHLYAQENAIMHTESSAMREQIQQKSIRLQETQDSLQELQASLEEQGAKIKDALWAKEQAESQNSDLRVKELEFKEEIRSGEKERQVLLAEKTELDRQRNKSSEQISKLTSKLLEKMQSHPHDGPSQLQKIRQAALAIHEMYLSLKSEFLGARSEISQHLQHTRQEVLEEVQQIRQAATILFAHLTEEKDGLEQRLREMERGDDKVKLVAREGRMQEALWKCGQLRQEVQNLGGYNSYIKGEFRQHFHRFEQMAQATLSQARRQEQIISSQYDDAYQAKLHIHSLRNQMASFKALVATQIKHLGAFIGDFLAHQHLQTSQPRTQASLRLGASRQVHEIIVSCRPVQEEAPQTDLFLGTMNSFGNVNLQIENQLGHLNGENEVEVSMDMRIDNEKKMDMDSEVEVGMEGYINRESDMEQTARSPQFRRVCCEQGKESLQEFGLFPLAEVGWESGEVERVVLLLSSLRDLESEEPAVPYFQAIRPIFEELKAKIRLKSLNLDISGLSFRPPTSPSSVGFSKDFFFDRRFNSEPNEDNFVMRDSNRSEHLVEKGNNKALMREMEVLQERLGLLDQREEDYRIQISELEKKVTELENENSIQIVTQLLLMLLKNLFEENWKEVETSCRTLLKMIRVSPEQIRQTLDNLEVFATKKKKRNSGGFMTIFNS